MISAPNVWKITGRKKQYKLEKTVSREPKIHAETTKQHQSKAVSREFTATRGDGGDLHLTFPLQLWPTGLTGWRLRYHGSSGFCVVVQLPDIRIGTKQFRIVGTSSVPARVGDSDEHAQSVQG